MTQNLRIALAQVDTVLGDVEANLASTRAVMARARDARADLVVFPELSLTGYALGHVDEDVSRAAGDAELTGLAAEADGMACVIGFAEAGRVHTYNSAAYLEGGRVRHVHRKLYLPTYDIWEERKHFTPGRRAARLRHAVGPRGGADLRRRVAAGGRHAWPCRTGRAC